MAEWLTHILLAYALFTVVGWYVEWLDSKWVAVGMVGSMLPDLSRLDLLIESDQITARFGIPFEWGGLHTLGGAVVLSAIGAVLFATRQQRYRAFGLLFAGALSHIIVDLPQTYADGLMVTNLYLFPLPPWRFPTPGWYVSADRWVVVVSLAVGLAVFVVDYYRRQQVADANDS